MYELLNINFVFITKQGFFNFLDKLSKVNLIEVKKDLTKLFFIVIAKTLPATKSGRRQAIHFV